ncbi:MAG: helix-turn-helix domain-containing protein [Ruminococcus sp.]|nr:helix-turn-helix domain-containing protein [Ruminococcus sp.]
MIIYDPLFQTMERKGISSYKLGKMGFPMSTYHSIKKGRHISTQTIDALCNLLECDVCDIISHQRKKEDPALDCGDPPDDDALPGGS